MLVKLVRAKAFYQGQASESLASNGSSINGNPAEERLIDAVRADDSSIRIMHSSRYDIDVANQPETPKDQLVPWHIFNEDIYSTELVGKEELEACDSHSDALIDVRPYLVDDPIRVQTYSKMQNILDIFRLHHLKSIPVIESDSGELKGIITRADIF